MSQTMFAARLHHGATEFSIDEVPVPSMGATDCLVAVGACGICGSDLHIIEGRTAVPYRPITLGHEPAGVVAAVGDDVSRFSLGERVFVNPIIACGKCRACRQGRSQICVERTLIGIHREGALAEFVAVPGANLIRLPPNISLTEAAIIESASVPYHALTARAPVTPGDAVAIFGVGGIGLHGVQIARLAGASIIVAVDIAEVPLERARRLGATHVVNGLEADPLAAIRDVTGAGVDIALECVGAPQSLSWAVEAIRPGGIAVLAGIGVDPIALPPSAIFARTELDVRGAYGYSSHELERVALLIASGQLDANAAISEVMPLHEVNAALESLREERKYPVRIIITPTVDAR